MNEKKTDKVTESIDYVFKMRQDGRMDKEEAGLILEGIFSGAMKDEDLDIIKFIYLKRPKEGIESEVVDQVPNSRELGITIIIELK